MNFLTSIPQLRNPDLSRPDAPPALATYMVDLAAYQAQRTTECRATMFRSYRRWIRSFLDDEGEADRAAKNFLIALRTQAPESQEMGAAA